MKFRVSMGLVGNDKVGGDRFMYTSDPYTVDSSDLVGGENTDTHIILVSVILQIY